MTFLKLIHVLKKIPIHFEYGPRPQPSRDWLMVFSVCLLLLVGSASWSYWLFRDISTRQPLRSNPSREQLSFPALDTVQDIFKKRAEQQARYLSEIHFIDPSK